MSNFYGATGLIGGNSGDLDNIDGTNLATADGAFVVTSTAVYVYYLNATSAAAESSPDIIQPDANGGDKRWILVDIIGEDAIFELLKLYDTDKSHTLSVKWNEDDSGDRVLNLLVAGGDRSLTLNENFIVGDGNAGTITFTGASKTLSVEDDSVVNQDLSSDASPTFGGITTLTSPLSVANGGTASANASDARTALGLAIGTDILAQQTIGIANDNLLEVDGTPLDTEVAVFTANGINGLSNTEVKSLLTYLQAGDAINMADALLTRPEIKDYSETPSALSTATNVLTVDLENGNVFTYTPSENATTFTISNWLASKAQSFTIYLTQGATAYAIDWTDESIIWAGGTAPDITTVSTKYVIVISSPDGGTTKYGAFLEDVKAP